MGSDTYLVPLRMICLSTDFWNWNSLCDMGNKFWWVIFLFVCSVGLVVFWGCFFVCVCVLFGYFLVGGFGVFLLGLGFGCCFFLFWDCFVLFVLFVSFCLPFLFFFFLVIWILHCVPLITPCHVTLQCKMTLCSTLWHVITMTNYIQNKDLIWKGHIWSRGEQVFQALHGYCGWMDSYPSHITNI